MPQATLKQACEKYASPRFYCHRERNPPFTGGIHRGLSNERWSQHEEFWIKSPASRRAGGRRIRTPECLLDLAASDDAGGTCAESSSMLAASSTPALVSSGIAASLLRNKFWRLRQGPTKSRSWRWRRPPSVGQMSEEKSRMPKGSREAKGSPYRTPIVLPQ